MYVLRCPKRRKSLSGPLTGNVSPYSSGLPGASLTSTSVDPTLQTSRLVWDEEELMYEAISNPPKGKGKEADVGKRRAYVRVSHISPYFKHWSAFSSQHMPQVSTSLGGSLNVELFCEKVSYFEICERKESSAHSTSTYLSIYQAPKTCYNFLMLAREGKYDNCIFHRLIPGFMVSIISPSLLFPRTIPLMLACTGPNRRSDGHRQGRAILLGNALP